MAAEYRRSAGPAPQPAASVAVLGTEPVFIASTAVTILQSLFTYTPFMKRFFDTRPIGPIGGLMVVAVGPVLLPVPEVEKRAWRNWVRARRARQESLAQ